MFDVIDRDVPVHEAAMLTVNPCTAYRLLEDNGVREGETVVLNAATSGVGRALLQLARDRGIHTIAMCRPRQSAEATEEVLAGRVDARAVADDGVRGGARRESIEGDARVGGIEGERWGPVGSGIRCGRGCRCARCSSSEA